MSEMEIPMAPAGNPMASYPAANQYVFPAYWGGMVVSQTPPKIGEALTALRREVGSLGAKKVAGGPQFPVRSAKELMQKLAEALDALGMQAFPIAQEVHHFDTANIPSNATASGKPVFRTLAHVKSTVRIGASDGSYVDVVGSGHGGDVDDKAGGKADTYAWKSALLKGLSVPEQDMPDTDDEAPSEPEPRRVAKEPVKPREKTDKAEKAGDTAVLDMAALQAKILAADDAELESIKDEIVSGRAGLSNSEKLVASATFVKRRAEGPNATSRQ